MEFMACMASMKLDAMYDRLSKLQQDGMKLAEEGVRHIRPGESIPGARLIHDKADVNYTEIQKDQLLGSALHKINYRCLR